MHRSRLFYLTILVCLCAFIASCGYSTDSFLAKGEEYLQKRKFHDAMMQFRSAAESDPSSSKAHWGLARSYENLGMFNETLDELRKTTELDPSNVEAKAKLGNYFLLLQPPLIAETEELRDEILELDPRFIEAHILSASIMAAQGKPDEDVVKAVEQAIDLDPMRIESYVSLQRLYMTRERPVEAEAAIKRGIDARPDSVLGRTEYGRFLTYASRDKEAEEQFKKAIEINESDIEAREAIADFYVRSKQFDLAEKAYFQLVAIQENSPESRLDLAKFYETTNRKEDAIATIEKILSEAPEYALARYRLGQIYLDLKRPEKVNEQLEELFKINDNDNEALLLRARLNMQEGKADLSVKDLEEVLKRYPSGREPLFLMAQARLSLGQIDQGNAFIADLERYHPSFLRTGLLKIQSAFSSGDAAAAHKLSNELIDKANAAVPNADADPVTILDIRMKALSSRGLASLELGKTADAKADLQEVVSKSPRSAAALINLAKVLVVERNTRGALDNYERALDLDPQNFDAANGVVNSYIALKKTEKAHKRIDSMIDANAGRANVIAAFRFLKATVYKAERDHKAAERELLAAIELDEDYLPAYSAYASLLHAQDRIDEAISQYQHVIEKRPAATAYTMIGILEDSRGKTSDAEASYRKALELAPDSPIAANNLAWLLADNNGNLDEALQLANLAVSKNSSTAGFYDTLGWVYLKKGLNLPAVQQLKKAVSLEEANARRTGIKPNPAYRLRLGMALARSGDKMSARQEVESSLKHIDVLTQREVADAKSVLATL